VAALIALLGLLGVAGAAAQTAASNSLDEVNKELSNPISSIWALNFSKTRIGSTSPIAMSSTCSFSLFCPWP
jgi:hypothetical protein